MLRYLLLVILFVSLASATAFSQIISLQDGDWTDPNTWDCTCVPNAASSTITISQFTTVTVSTSITADQVIVDGDGILNIDNGGTLNIVDGAGNDLVQNFADFFNTFSDGQVNVNTGGILDNAGQIVSIPTAMNINSGGEYRHNQNGNAIIDAVWGSGSTCRITGWTNALTGTAAAIAFRGSLIQSFHHFIWDSPAQTAPTLFFEGQLMNVGGDLIISSMQPNRRITLGYSTNTSGSMTIGRDLIVRNGAKASFGASSSAGGFTINVGRNVQLSHTSASGGSAYILTGAGITTLNIAGDLIMDHFVTLNDGEFILAPSTTSGTINISGNLIHNGGSFNKTGAGAGTINFVGPASTTHTYTRTNGTFSNVAIGITLAANNILDLGTGAIGAANGSFTSDGTVILRSIFSTGSNGAVTGNIAPTTRTFNSGSIVYQGSGGQFMGSDHPAGINTTINNIAGVSLVTNVTLNSVVTLTSGNLNIGANTLTLGGSLVPGANSLGITSLSNLTINGTGAFGTLPLSGASLNNLSINRTVSGSVTLGSSLTIDGSFGQTAGTLVLNGNTLTVNAGYTGSGNITTNASSSLVINGTGALPGVTFVGGAINSLTLNRPSASLTPSGALTITSLNLTQGTFNNSVSAAMATGGTITVVNGSMANSPGGAGLYNVVYDNSTLTTDAEIPVATDRLGNLTFINGAQVSLNKSCTVNGNILITNGGLDADNFIVTLLGNLTANSGGTFNASTFEFAGTTVISGTGVPEFGSITLMNSASLTIPPVFLVAGDIQLDAGGTFNNSSGTVTLTGTTLQTIAGGGKALNNVIVNKTPGTDVALTSTLVVDGALTVVSAATQIASNGNLLIRSTSDGVGGNGRIGPLLNGAIVSGNVIVERFMSSEGRIYRYLSSPVTNAPVSQVQTFFPVTGPFSGSSTCTGCTTNASMFTYDAGTAAYVGFPVASVTEVVAPGVGYASYVRQDVLPGPVTEAWTGPINQGDIVLPVVHNAGVANSYNLVGNPYPASIDWDIIAGWTKVNMSGSIAVRDNPGGGVSFRYWNGSVPSGTGGGLANGEIAKGQAFWVETTGTSPSLTIHEQAKTVSSAPFYREAGDIEALSITMLKGVLNDMTVLQIHEEASVGRDNMDAAKMVNDNFDFSLRVPGGERMAISAMNTLTCDMELILDMQFTKLANGNYVLNPQGDYSFNFETLGTYFNSRNITLLDQFAARQEAVVGGSIYAFTITSDPASMSSTRFKLLFTDKPPVLDLEVTAPDLACQQGNVFVTVKNTQDGYTYHVINNDVVISDELSGDGKDITFEVTADMLVDGSNLLEIGVRGICLDQKLLTSVNLTREVLLTPNAVAGKHCQAGTVTLTASGATGTQSYRWYANATDESVLATTAQLTTPELQNSTSYFVSIVGEKGCESSRTEVMAEIVNFENASITINEGDILESNFETNNQWLFNGEIIPQATGKTYTAVHSGVYGLQVNVNGCTTDTDVNYTVTGLEDMGLISSHVYPNPAFKDLYIDLTAEFEKATSLSLMGEMGQDLGQFNIISVSGRRTAHKNVEQLPNGLYFVKVVFFEKAQLYKVIKSDFKKP